jgi:hypothetical protein
MGGAYILGSKIFRNVKNGFGIATDLILFTVVSGVTQVHAAILLLTLHAMLAEVFKSHVSCGGYPPRLRFLHRCGGRLHFPPHLFDHDVKLFGG